MALGRKPYALAAHETVVRELVASQPDLTIDEVMWQLGERGIRVGRSSVGRFLQAYKLTLKKKSLHAAEQQQRDVAHDGRSRRIHC